MTGALQEFFAVTVSVGLLGVMVRLLILDGVFGND